LDEEANLSGPLFTGNDLQLIESLVRDPKLEPAFDYPKNCLVWSDERPDGLTRAGYEALADLLMARSFIHQGKDFSTYTISPDYFKNIWDRAMAHPFKWPGFDRLELSASENAYYEKMQKKDYEGDY